MPTAYLLIATLLFFQQPLPNAPEPTPSNLHTQAPDASNVYRVGDGVSTPKLLYAPDPEFSELARKNKIVGNCEVSIVVGTDGHVSKVQVIHSISEKYSAKLRAAALSMDDKVVEAVRQYRYKPGLLRGQPVPVVMTTDVNFQIF